MRKTALAAVCGTLLTVGLAAAPATATPATAPTARQTAPALDLSPSKEREFAGLADSKQDKPTALRSAAARSRTTSTRTASAATLDDCTPYFSGTPTTSPPKLPVGVSVVQTVTFAARLYDPCDWIGSVSVVTYNQASGSWADGYLAFDSYDDLTGEYAMSGFFDVDPRENINADAGEWAWTLAAIDYDDYDEASPWDVQDGRSWYMQRITRLTNNATEPAKKGTSITISAALTRANWESLSYKAYTGQTLTLQRRPAAGGPYVNVKTVTTDAYGKAATKVTAVSDACFRYTFAGKSVSTPVTASGDCVDVY